MTADEREGRAVSEAFDLDALLKRHPLPWRCEAKAEPRMGGPPHVWGASVYDAAGVRVVPLLMHEDIARLLAAAPGMVKAIRDHLEWGPKTSSDRSLCDDALKASLP